jgi:hypothetical protein
MNGETEAHRAVTIQPQRVCGAFSVNSVARALASRFTAAGCAVWEL